MTKGKQISEDEIERQLIADADNPVAWEEPVTVPASTSSRPDWYGRSKKTNRATRKSTRPRKTSASKRPVSADKSSVA